MIRDRFRRFVQFCKRTGVAVVKVLRLWPEGLQGIGILAGWALVTFGLASITVWQVWPISLGILFLSLVGWGHLRVLFGQGLYSLSRRPTKAKKV